ncbi:nuclear transport factor 2 family protein [Spirosoma gilvum]
MVLFWLLSLTIGLNPITQPTSKFLTKPGGQLVSENELLTLEKRWNQAIIDHDTTYLATLLDPQFLFLSADGKIYERRSVLNFAGNREYKIKPYETEDVRVRISENTAILTGKFTQTITYKDQSATYRFCYTDVYVKREGAWKALSAQATLLNEQRK